MVRLAGLDSLHCSGRPYHQLSIFSSSQSILMAYDLERYFLWSVQSFSRLSPLSHQRLRSRLLKVLLEARRHTILIYHEQRRGSSSWTLFHQLDTPIASLLPSRLGIQAMRQWNCEDYHARILRILTHHVHQRSRKIESGNSAISCCPASGQVSSNLRQSKSYLRCSS